MQLTFTNMGKHHGTKHLGQLAVLNMGSSYSQGVQIVNAEELFNLFIDLIKNLHVSCVRCSFAYVLDIFLYEANSKRATLQTTM